LNLNLLWNKLKNEVNKANVNACKITFLPVLPMVYVNEYRTIRGKQNELVKVMKHTIIMYIPPLWLFHYRFFTVSALSSLFSDVEKGRAQKNK